MFGLPKYGDGIGLHRILRYCHLNGIDINYLSAVSVVITGSKGKGSTARFAYTILKSMLPNTGCFISPHLFDFTERYEFAGERISKSTFAKHKNAVLSYAELLKQEKDSLGEFELLFLIALRWFNDLRPDCIVWEAGIGGRYDPVRALQASLSVLTSVELEHTELLGHSLELIAYDKLDAVRPGGCAFVSPAVSPRLYPRLRAFCQVAQKNICFVADEVEASNINISVDGTSYTLTEKTGATQTVVLTLIGHHQALNSLSAIALARSFSSQRAVQYSSAKALNALRSTAWPGRLERLSVCPDVWIDVGHTPESVRVVSDEFLKLYSDSDVLAIFGVSYNKSIDEIVEIVENRFGQIILARANKNGLDSKQLKQRFKQQGKVIACYDDIIDAVHAIRTSFNTKPTIVLGGLFLAAEFAYAWRGGNPNDLNFF